VKESVINRNNIKTWGNGLKTILFAHGFGCDQNMWRYVTSAFEDDYKIVVFDYVGAGRSDLSAYNSERYSSLVGYAQDVLEVCEAMELTDIIYVGHSVSCMIGVLAALKRPQYFSDLILIGPSPCYINSDGYIGGFSKRDIDELLDTMDKNYIGWANFLAPAIMKNAERPELSEELTESFCSTDPKIARQFAMATFLSDNRSDLANVRTPSLIMQCSDDLIAPVEVGEYLHRNLTGSTLKILAATGHCPHMSHPEETIAVIKAYLAKKE